jgi:hypothetical protein
MGDLSESGVSMARRVQMTGPKTERAFKLRKSKPRLSTCRALGRRVPSVIEKPCYDCGERMITMRFNPKTDRYEGERICRFCAQSFKRKYAAG